MERLWKVLKAGLDWGFGDLVCGGYFGMGIGGLMVLEGGGGGGDGREEKRLGFGRDAKIAIVDIKKGGLFS